MLMSGIFPVDSLGPAVHLLACVMMVKQQKLLPLASIRALEFMIRAQFRVLMDPLECSIALEPFCPCTFTQSSSVDPRSEPLR